MHSFVPNPIRGLDGSRIIKKAMTDQDFDYLSISRLIAQEADWRNALDILIKFIRKGLIYDNLAVYLNDPDDPRQQDVIFARAVGRGQAAEADVSWGEQVATQVVSTGKKVVSEPLPGGDPTDRVARLQRPYLLGLPLRTPDRVMGALVFVRFGGPPYTPDHINQSQFAAHQIGFLLERRALMSVIRRLDEARRQIQLQEDFIATMSHELRTPLGFIKGYSTTLLRRDTKWDADTTREFLEIIEDEADHLTDLIETILQSARLQSHTLELNFQPVRLDSLVSDVLVRCKSRNPNLSVAVVGNASPLMQADAVRVAQVLENFFGNAIKYAPGSPIEIEINEVDDSARIRFSDFGPGIPPEHLPHIFERFYRVSGVGRAGTGLGLFICKQIVEAHHGSISVMSQPGQGTTFTVSLPLRQAVGQ